MKDILVELRWRGLLHQSTDERELTELLSKPQTVYVGFDPTASSLHAGSLLPLMTLRRFQQFGHRPIALVGGATGMIGDPSGKSQERNLLSPAILEENVNGLREQMSRFLDFTADQPALLVNNFDWMGSWSYIDFLREVGKNFPVNVMLAKDSVKTRLGKEDSGLSYTEFSYMLLQAYDFAHLAEKYDCALQVGGSDQWGNITAGIDLARRMHGKHLQAMTCPLLLTSDGSKMGKTANGAVWLDGGRTSPYEFFQYWYNVPDSDVMMCIKFLTEIDQDECMDLEKQTLEDPGKRAAQTKLATWLTEFIHGAEALQTAEKAREILFGKAEITGMTDAQIDQIFSGVPSGEVTQADLSDGINIVDALAAAGVATSKSDARRTAKEGGASVNNVKVGDDKVLTVADLASESTIVLRRGKKKFGLLRVKG
ncbi:MAG: tyrosine--tRNA ligase [Planctomycetota bacterium]|nr:tyrosine--tRNA ligase [Planctomycetota bacterium]